MSIYTVIGYSLPDGGHVVQSIHANDSTAAAVGVRARRGLNREEFEVVAVAEGEVKFTTVDHTQLNLAPYAPSGE